MCGVLYRDARGTLMPGHDLLVVQVRGKVSGNLPGLPGCALHRCVCPSCVAHR
jgi:hypothetical protein